MPKEADPKSRNTALARALRENLKRRKQQARARSSASGDAPGGGEATDTGADERNARKDRDE